MLTSALASAVMSLLLTRFWTITSHSPLGRVVEAMVKALESARAGHFSSGSGYTTRKPLVSAILNTDFQAGSLRYFLLSAKARVAKLFFRKFWTKNPVGLVTHWMNLKASAWCVDCELSQYAYWEYRWDSAPRGVSSGAGWAATA